MTATGLADQVDSTAIRQAEVGDQDVGGAAREKTPPLLARASRAQQSELWMTVDRTRQALARAVVVLDEDDAILGPERELTISSPPLARDRASSKHAMRRPSRPPQFMRWLAMSSGDVAW